MIDTPRPSALFLTGFLLMATTVAAAQEKQSAPPATAPPADAAEEGKPAPYDQRLIRLAEILGSVHYLRNLCLDQLEDGWRRSTQELIEKEAAGEPKRRERITAAFNRATEPLPRSIPSVRSPPRWRKNGTVPKAQHSPRKSSHALEIRRILTSFSVTPCRFGKRLLSLLREW